MGKQIGVAAAIAFAAGFIVGHFAGPSVFGYRSYNDCVMGKAKEAGPNAYILREQIVALCSKYSSPRR